MFRKPRLQAGIVLSCSVLALGIFASEPSLESGWLNPPREARLRAYWWWLNGDVTEQERRLQPAASIEVRRLWVQSRAQEENCSVSARLKPALLGSGPAALCCVHCRFVA
jgi:hypothetical protein